MRPSQAKDQLVELGADDVTSMRARLDTTIPGGPQSAWDMDAALRQYAAFDAELRAVPTACASRRRSPSAPG